MAQIIMDFVGTHQFTHELTANKITSQQTLKKPPKNQSKKISSHLK